MKKYMYKIVKRLCTLFFPGISVDLYIIPYFKLLSKTIKTNGLVHSIKVFKGMRLHCTRYLCGEPLLFNKLNIGVDKYG